MKKIIWIIVGIAIVGLVIFKLASNKKTTESKVYQFDKEKPISVGVDTIQLVMVEFTKKKRYMRCYSELFLR